MGAHRPQNDDYLYNLETFKRKVGRQEQQIDAGIGRVWQEMRNKTLLLFYLMPFVLVLGLVVYNINVPMKQTPLPKKKVEQTQAHTPKQTHLAPKPAK